MTFALPIVDQPRSNPAPEPAGTGESFDDWRWQLRHRITGKDDIAARLPLTPDEEAGLDAAPGHFRVAITPYYFSLIDREHPSCPVRIQVIPRARELVNEPGDLIDPLGEDSHSPATGIFHRYPDRCLLLALDRCAIYCRHCNRRRLVGQEESPISRDDLDRALDYIRRTPAIRDVLISGGDPLTLSTARLEEIIAALRAIPHVEIIRIGTRVPVVLPMRVDDELCAMLKKYHPLYVNTHFNHPKELTPRARAACEKLADAGIPIGNQTVLLRGVNSSVRVLRKLFTELLRCRVRPYYLFQGDVAAGTSHLRTSVETGIALMQELRGHISGLAIPHLVIDTPGGMGKVSIGPDYVVARGPDKWTLRNYEGKLVDYPQPADKDATCAYDEIFFSSRVARTRSCRRLHRAGRHRTRFTRTPRRRARRNRWRAVRPIAAVDGQDVSRLGKSFSVLLGCHIVQLLNKVGQINTSNSGGYVGITGGATFALRMRANFTYEIEVQVDSVTGPVGQLAIQGWERPAAAGPHRPGEVGRRDRRLPAVDAVAAPLRLRDPPTGRTVPACSRRSSACARSRPGGRARSPGGRTGSSAPVGSPS